MGHTTDAPDTRTPDWQVQAVFDPDGGGQDFAYTIGLHDRGLPELHLWARPSLGEDPGDDWMLSPSDRCRILNEAAWRAVDGMLGVGDTFEATYDDGLVTASFRVDPPGDRDELEALGIAPGATVLPLRWSLQRPPIRPPRPLSARSLRLAGAEYADVVATLPAPRRMPEGWRLPERFAPVGDFGPLSPMVAARVAQLWTADAATLSSLLWAGVTAEQADLATWPVPVAAAVARELGRVEEVARTAAASAAVVEALTLRPDWPETSRELVELIGFEPGEATPEQIEQAWRRILGQLLWSVMATEVVADRLSSVQRFRGRGTWLFGFGPVGELPGPQWRAPKAVLDRLVAALEPLSFRELALVSVRQCDQDWEDYHEVAGRVQGWALVSAAGCPWRGVLDRLPGLRGLAQPMTALQEWASVMTSAASHRDALTADDVSVLCSPFLHLLPQLPEVIAG